MFSKVRLLLILILTGLCLFGCNLTRRVSFLSDLVCSPPCWFNITPGVTTQEEALEILYELPFIDKDSVSTKGFYWNSFDDTIFFRSATQNWDGEAYVIDHKIVLIGFYGKLNVTFEEAARVCGDPKFVINNRGQTSFSISALDPDKGVAYTFNTADLPRNKRNELRPDTPIRLIEFFDPMKYDELLEVGMFSMLALNREETLKYMRPWTGYGSISQKYPPARIP